MNEFATSKLPTDSEHHTVADSINISENGPGIITVTKPNLEQIIMDTVSAHGTWNIKTVQAEPVKGASGTASEAVVEKLADVQEQETTETILEIYDRLGFPGVTVSQSEQAVARSTSFPKDSPVHENSAGVFQSTVHDTETIVNTVESATEKGSGRSFFLKVKEIARQQPESVSKTSPSLVNIPSFQKSFGQLSRKVSENWANFPVKEILNKKESMNEFESLQKHEIIPVTITEHFREDGFTHSEIDDLNAAHYNSSERGTFVTTGIHRNSLATEIGHNYKDSEFSENSDKFFSYSQEQLVDNKLTTTAVSLVQNGNNLFPSIPVDDGKNLEDKLGASLMPMTTIPVSGNGSNIDSMNWSFQNDKHFAGNFGKHAPNFETSADMQHNYITTTEPMDLATYALSTDKGLDSNTHSVDNDDISHIDSDVNIGIENSRLTSTHTNAVTWENYADNIIITNNVGTTVATEIVGIDQSKNVATLQQTSISITDDIQMNSDYEMNESLNQTNIGKFGTDKSQQIQLTSEQINSDKTMAVVLYPERVRIETEAKEEWPEEDDSLESGFRINEMKSQETSKLK